MIHISRALLIVLGLIGICLSPSSLAAEEKVIRIGIIGCDTSHVPAFTKMFNDPKAEGELAGFKVVAAFAGGSPDIPKHSTDRIPKFVEEIKKYGVEMVDSIPELLKRVDVVLIESNDGRPHLEQARLVLEARKPVFIDKPLTASLADAIAIADLAKKNDTPWFSSSSIRFGPKLQAIKSDPKVGDIVGVTAWSPCPTEEHHPDLFWYGIHGVEALYTLMGPGCESVTRVSTAGEDVATGVWKGGRVGIFRGLRDAKGDYGAIAFGKKGVSAQLGFEGYKPLAEAIARFFKSGKPPIPPEETIELIAFMQAADESKARGGAAVKIEEVMAKARSQGEKKVAP